MHKYQAILVLTGLVFTISPAYAYLDPGTGSIILQGVLAGIAVLLVTGRYWWHKLLVLIGVRKPVSEQTDGEGDSE